MTFSRGTSSKIGWFRERNSRRPEVEPYAKTGLAPSLAIGTCTTLLMPRGTSTTVPPLMVEELRVPASNPSRRYRRCPLNAHLLAIRVVKQCLYECRCKQIPTWCILCATGLLRLGQNAVFASSFPGTRRCCRLQVWSRLRNSNDPRTVPHSPMVLRTAQKPPKEACATDLAS